VQSSARTVKEYLDSLPDDRRKAIQQLRTVVRKSLPEGFKEVMSYGMIGYVVPHSAYANGYHVDPKLPLPFINIASQKNHVAVYHMALYADKKLLAWFTKAYATQVTTKLDMGKGCIRFKRADQIPLALIGELATKMSPAEWIKLYEKNIKK